MQDIFFLGESFVTNKSDPGDMDCIIVFNKDNDVPSRTEELLAEQTRLDNIHEVNDHQGVLVTIHGLLSQGKWNAEIAPIASSQGWIFAPYIYEGNTPDLIINSKKRQMVLDNFRGWIYDLQERYPNYKISVIAYSYGSHIIASYIEGFEEFVSVFLIVLFLLVHL